MTAIRNFFRGRSVLLTGITGFLAKTVLEKLLREVPDVGHVYLLVRASETATAQQRARIALSSIAFNGLRTLRADFDGFVAEKITVVPGDVAARGLGLSEEDRATLRHEVDVVLHAAAPANLDQRLDEAIEANALGPARLLEFAKTCRRPPVFVHVSTAFVNGLRTGLVEAAPLDPTRSIAMELGRADRFDLDAELAFARELPPVDPNPRRAVTTAYRRGLDRARANGWHDVFSYTKALGEMLLFRDAGPVRLQVVRPTVIASALREPVAGFIEGFRVLEPLLAGIGAGLLPSFPYDPDTVLDLVPVDFVASAVLAAAAAPEAGVYHVGTGARNPVRAGDVVAHARRHYQRSPARDRHGRPVAPSSALPTSARLYKAGLWLRYASLALVLELVGQVLGISALVRKSRHTRARLREVLHIADVYEAYGNYRAIFGLASADALRATLSFQERLAFGFDPMSVSWPEYVADVHCAGVRRFVLRQEIAPKLRAPVALVDGSFTGSRAAVG